MTPKRLPNPEDYKEFVEAGYAVGLTLEEIGDIQHEWLERCRVEAQAYLDATEERFRELVSPNAPAQADDDEKA